MWQSTQDMRSMRFPAALSFVLLAPILAFSQVGPEKGGHEVQIWAGGGHSVSGGRGNTGAFNAGLRYGWILTGPHLPSFLRGRFEYAVDGVPVFLVFQPANTAYGVGFDPLGLKWNFERHGTCTSPTRGSPRPTPESILCRYGSASEGFRDDTIRTWRERMSDS